MQPAAVLGSSIITALGPPHRPRCAVGRLGILQSVIHHCRHPPLPSVEQVDGRTAQVSSVHVLPVTVFAEPLTEPEPEPESQADDTEVQLVRVLPHTTYAFGYTVPTVPAWHATTDDGELPSPTPLHQAEY